MELNWTLFSEKDPTHENIYITDFKEVWVKDPRCVWIYEKSKTAWAEIPIPEVPDKKREFHLHVSGYYRCYQSEIDGKLKLRGPYDIAEHIIQFCPFCGYNPEES